MENKSTAYNCLGRAFLSYFLEGRCSFLTFGVARSWAVGKLASRSEERCSVPAVEEGTWAAPDSCTDLEPWHCDPFQKTDCNLMEECDPLLVGKVAGVAKQEASVNGVHQPVNSSFITRINITSLILKFFLYIGQIPK